ncbi:MAG: response regulator [Candidatus Omnitrophota bacterium]
MTHPPESSKKPGCHILIIDDEIDFLNSLAFWFKSHGYTVDTAESGAQGLEILKTKTPNIILLDIMMPDMDGLDTLKGIKQIKAEVPVVLMTAFATEDRRLEAYKLGANAFLDKTVDFYKAEHLINSLVRVVTKEKP